jgi:hypothetical protein
MTIMIRNIDKLWIDASHYELKSVFDQYSGIEFFLNLGLHSDDYHDTKY